MLVYPENIPLIAASIPFGMYEWIVMPMGDTNAFITY